MARMKVEEAGKNKILKNFIWYTEEFKPHKAMGIYMFFKAMGKLKKEDK